ncbi:MAG: hypothetical protein IPO64_14890 [Bacteroidetes bacterium]|nr:hypothetical protein [Bacteroidota bacterium]
MLTQIKALESPLQHLRNNPISFIDPNGDDSSGTFTQARANPNNPKADFSDLDKNLSRRAIFNT